MWRFLYNVVLYLVSPVVWLRLAWRNIVSNSGEPWLERLGLIPRLPAKGPIWLHATSAEEVLTAAPLVRALREKLPSVPLVLTTTTSAAAARAQHLFGAHVAHFHAPYDYPGAIRRLLNRLTPRAAILMGPALWPNLIHHCHRRDVPVVLANARMSARSVRRFRWIAPLTGATLARVSLAACESRLQGRRLVMLGLAPERLLVTGSPKFDLDLPRSTDLGARELTRQWGERLVLSAAHTHEGEERLMLAAYAALKARFPSLLLVLAPRRRGRLGSVADLVRERFEVARLSAGRRVGREIDVLLADATGELSALYGASDVVVMGGSFVRDARGEDVIEAALHAAAVITGPYYDDWEDVMTLFLDARAIAIAPDSRSLEEGLTELLSSASQRRAQGRRALEVVEVNRGATRVLLDRIEFMVADRSRYSTTA